MSIHTYINITHKNADAYARMLIHTVQICIEPYRSIFIGKDMQPHITVIKSVLQLAPMSEFDRLGPNDVLYIDSSHVAQPFGDTVLELAFILPRLRKGVIVHVHDIFLPDNYPDAWIYTRAFTEQFWLALFLHKNDEWEVLWSNWYMGKKHPDMLKQAGFKLEGYHTGSAIWLRKKI